MCAAGNVQPNRHTLVMVVSSSLGNTEGLLALVKPLPKDLAAPLLVGLPLEANRLTSFQSLLQSHTSLPIEVVSSRSTLEPGKIYILSSQRSLALTNSHIEVVEEGSRQPHSSIDSMLAVGATEYGENLIAVILAGTASESVVGAIEVKDAGGTIIVQKHQSAHNSSIFSLIPPTVVDFEEDIDQIGPLLVNLLTSMSQVGDKSEDMLHEILSYISHQTNLDFHSYKTSSIQRRIGRRMAATYNQTLAEYWKYLKAHSEEIGVLVKAFLINVTQFFRDPDAYAYLKDEVLPIIVARARERDRVLRFWSAGCATGEEAYSLAMLITDFLGAELGEWSIKIFATDLDEAALNFGRRGFYSENLLTGVPPGHRERFFERIDSGFTLSKTLRQMVIFGHQDLGRSAPFPRIDLVMCRNVLIYFSTDLQEYVLNQFAYSLGPTSGFLLLGKAETVRLTQSHYELFNKQWKVFRCTGTTLPLPRRVTQMKLSASHLETLPSHRRAVMVRNQFSGQDSPPQSLEIGQLRRYNELLFRYVPIGLVMIDRSYRLLTANATARRLIGLREASNEQDFLHAVRGIPYAEMRNAIDAVFRDRSTLTLHEVELETSAGGNGRTLSFSIALMQVESGVPDLAVISVNDVTEQVQIRRQLEAAHVEQAQLLTELGATNKRLNNINKELLDANEELQVTNEELVLTHEELQAMVEEFETTNEELQATNEELETNNEELQATNEELQTTNEELRSRTTELQELTRMLESEQRRLAEMVELAPFYIMLLRGPKLVVEAFNPHYARLLEGWDIQGRPIEDVFQFFWAGGMEIVNLAREVYQQNKTRTSTRMLTYMPSNQGEAVEAYFVFTIVPSHGTSGLVDGVAIYASDVTVQPGKEEES